MLRIAIQNKGRLNEQSVALLREIGINVDEAKRKFLSKASNFPIEVLYLRDDDIPQVVANGTASLGIVGLNEVSERGFDVEVVAAVYRSQYPRVTNMRAWSISAASVSLRRTPRSCAAISSSRVSMPSWRL